MIKFSNLIVEPYLLLIIEYLDDPGRCSCNNYTNDVYSLSIVNKEVRCFMQRHNKIPFLYPEIIIIPEYQSYFNEKVYCTKHNYFDIDTILKSLKNITSIQNNTKCIKRHGSYCKEFIHCSTVSKAKEMKSWIMKNTQLVVNKEFCCSGLGFSISLQSDNNGFIFFDYDFLP